MHAEKDSLIVLHRISLGSAMSAVGDLEAKSRENGGEMLFQEVNGDPG